MCPEIKQLQLRDKNIPPEPKLSLASVADTNGESLAGNEIVSSLSGSNRGGIRRRINGAAAGQCVYCGSFRLPTDPIPKSKEPSNTSIPGSEMSIASNK